jgi:hypothetical protein
MRVRFAVVIGALGFGVACNNPQASLVSLTGTSTSGGTLGSSTSSGGTAGSSSSGGSTTGGRRFSCNLGDGGLFAAPITIVTGVMSEIAGAVVVGDLDNDGNLDVAVSYDDPSGINETGVEVLFGDGKGSFREIFHYGVFNYPQDLLIAPLGNPPLTSLAVMDVGTASQSGHVFIARFYGDGGMDISATLPVTSPGASFWESGSVADVNHDGLPDLLIGSNVLTSNTLEIEVLLGTDAGGWNAGGFLPAYDFNNDVVGDFNEDGIPDVVGQPTLGTDDLLLLLGNGDGTFADAGVIAHQPLGNTFFQIGDLNEDGHLDILAFGPALSSNGVASTLFLGRGDGTFTTSPMASPQYPFALRDLNGDGHLDTVVANTKPGISVLLGNGDGTFRPSSDVLLLDGGFGSVAIGDLNNDGRPDIITSNRGGGNVIVFLNNCR